MPILPHAPGSDRFIPFYDQFVERVYRYHLSRTGSVAEAEDLTSETFHAALENFSRCRAGEEEPWVIGIARHKLVDHFRRSKHPQPLETIEDWPDPDPSPEDQASQRLEIGQVAAALRRVTPERAEALTLHYFAGLGLAEVGRAMGRSEEAAKKLVQRALADLREALGVKKAIVENSNNRSHAYDRLFR